MTLNQLKAFLASARSGSFTAAAAELQVAQPSVSGLIRRLEDELGSPLFERGGRQLLVTPAGAELQPFAEQAVTAADGGVEAVRRMKSMASGTAAFGMWRNASAGLVSDLVAAFHERHPTVRVRMVGLNSGTAASAVAAGDLEAALVVLPIDNAGLTVTPLFRDEVLYASRNPQHVAAPVTLEQLSQARLVLYDAHDGWTDPTRRQLLERIRLAGLELTCSIEVEHAQSALDLVLRGVGDTIVDQALCVSPAWPPGLLTASFAEPLYDTIALIQRVNTVLSPATGTLVELAQRVLAGRRAPREMAHGAVPPHPPTPRPITHHRQNWPHSARAGAFRQSATGLPGTAQRSSRTA